MPTKLIFDGWRKSLKDNLINGNCLLVTTPGFRKRGLVDELCKVVNPDRICIHDKVTANPEIYDVSNWLDYYKNEDFKYIISIGGGSTIDVAKAFSFFLASNSSKDILDDFNDKGRSKGKSNAYPIIAIPTTSGSGSEVTPFATLWGKRSHKKYSLCHDSIRPSIAILDPILTTTLNYESSLISALDLISHAFESIWNRNANSLSILNATNSLSLAFKALPKLKENINDINLRSQLQVASCLSGMAISTTKTSLAHSISYPLTTHFGIPHGLASSFTLPKLFKFNLAEDDGRLVKLSEQLGYKSVVEFELFLMDLFIDLEINSIIKSYLPNNQNWIESICDDMYTPERAENNLRAPKTEDIKALVYQSLYC